MEDKDKLIEDLLLRVLKLEQRVNEIELSGSDTGVYLDGVPKYARDYIEERRKVTQKGQGK